MSSILDHVEQAVPRATVYGAMKGSPVFIGKYFREVNPASNTTTYNYNAGERRITFILASPDKTIFNDLRSAYVRFDLPVCTDGSGNPTGVCISEPASNFVERIVIKMNGTVVEDISRFDHLTSFFKRKLLTREQKNARTREGYDYVANARQGAAPTAALTARTSTGGADDAVNIKNDVDFTADNQNDGFIDALAVVINAAAEDVKAQVDAAIAANASPALGYRVDDADGHNQAYTVQSTNIQGAVNLCIKLDLSGIMNVQQLLSGYYSPLEIDLYLQDPKVCLAPSNIAAGGAVVPGGFNYAVSNVRLCLEQIVMSPEYVSAFEAALLANSSAQGIQIPFTTYYTYQQKINADTTFWVRKPVRYLKGVYWAMRDPLKEVSGITDSYRPCRVESGVNGNEAGRSDQAAAAGDAVNAARINSWRLSIGTKNYRYIDDTKGLTDAIIAYNANIPSLANCNESDIMFAKAVGHYNDYSTEDGSMNAYQRVLSNQCQGIDLEFSPDNDVLASETTLNSNDIRLEFKGRTPDFLAPQIIETYIQYQASIALFPGNETRLLTT